MQGWGACEHLRASVSLRVPTRSDISLEGRGRRWAAAQAQPSPAWKWTLLLRLFSQGRFGGRDTEDISPFLCVRGLPAPGLPPEGSSGSWAQAGLCACHTGTCDHMFVRTHKYPHKSYDHTHDYSLHIYTCNYTHVISQSHKVTTHNNMIIHMSSQTIVYTYIPRNACPCN